MSDDQLLSRITLSPNVMTGKPVIRGTRLTVEYVLGLLAHGASVAEILEEYEGLAPEDVQACLLSLPGRSRIPSSCRWLSRDGNALPRG